MSREKLGVKLLEMGVVDANKRVLIGCLTNFHGLEKEENERREIEKKYNFNTEEPS